MIRRLLAAEARCLLRADAFYRVGSSGRLSRDSGVSSVKFALRVKILGELVRLLRVYKIYTEPASRKATRALSAS